MTTENNYCGACGAANSDEAKFCASCGTALETKNQDQTAPGAEPTPEQATASADQTQSGTSTNQAQSGTYAQEPYVREADGPDGHHLIFHPEVFKFLASNQQFYCQKFKKMKQTASSTTWNVCAFMFGPAWYIYRKMYGIGIALIVAGWILPFIPIVGGLFSVGICIFNGVLGNYFYMNKMDKELSVIMQQPDQGARAMLMMKKGGTNIAGVLILAGIGLVVGIILVVVFFALGMSAAGMYLQDFESMYPYI